MWILFHPNVKKWEFLFPWSNWGKGVGTTVESEMVLPSRPLRTSSYLEEWIYNAYIIVLLWFWDKILPYNSGWPGIQDTTAPASKVSGLQPVLASNFGFTNLCLERLVTSWKLCLKCSGQRGRLTLVSGTLYKLLHICKYSRSSCF